MESQVSRKKTQKYTKNAQEKPRKYKLPGLSVMNRHEKLLVRIKHVISIHLYVYHGSLTVEYLKKLSQVA